LDSRFKLITAAFSKLGPDVTDDAFVVMQVVASFCVCTE